MAYCDHTNQLVYRFYLSSVLKQRENEIMPAEHEENISWTSQLSVSVLL